ncbi:MAG: tRNA (guanosine(37)-N1)-methyltransferase TrmD [Acidimicrobiales bacterium]
MRIDVLTIFPELVDAFASASLLGRARRAGLIDLRVHDLRAATTDPHRSVDDTPFGGGAGMVLMAEPILATVEAVNPPRPLLALGPGGDRFDQAAARRMATLEGFSLLCGRYEGIDQRALDEVVDGELSIGDVVLAGGEVAAMVVLEAVSRLVPGVMGNAASAAEESFSETGQGPAGSGGLLEYPHYTRPALVRDRPVPEVLLSGDHARIARWRRAHSLLRTATRRPDLWAARGGLQPGEAKLLNEFGLSLPEVGAPTGS